MPTMAKARPGASRRPRGFPPVPVEKWKCPYCANVYDTKAEAQRCIRDALAHQPRFAVGEVVRVPRGFGWFDGATEWVAGSAGKFHGQDMHAFYYVVVHVDNDPHEPHRPRYHLATRAMSGARGYRMGYTFDQHHITPERLATQPSLPGLADVLKELQGRPVPGLL